MTSAAFNFTYDKIYELTQVTQGTNTTESYSGVYPERSRGNAVGNRLSSLGVSPYSYNTSNELTSTPSGSYTYDANGNTLTDAAGRSYTWDFENRLKQVTLPSSGGTVTFLYDPFGRRIQKVYTTGANPPTTTTTNYLYDGDNAIETVDQNGNLLAKFAQGQNIDEPLAESVGGATYDYEQDGVGSVTSLTNSSGTLAFTSTYDSFGKITASSGSVSNPFRYTGRDFDSETGLYYYRARYYDPTTGRFLSEDRIAFGGGVDFYSYVLNRPVQLSDPTGLSAQDVRRIQDACKKCTKQLTDQGLRFNGSGRLSGWWNDLTSWFTKHEGCWNQALRAQPCVESPTVPYDDNWNFNVVPIEWGFHHVIQATDSNPNDPDVFCDPWRNISWTKPKKGTGGGGGW